MITYQYIVTSKDLIILQNLRKKLSTEHEKATNGIVLDSALSCFKEKKFDKLIEPINKSNTTNKQVPTHFIVDRNVIEYIKDYADHHALSYSQFVRFLINGYYDYLINNKE